MALDVGSSTGGFTDVLLQQGAAKVFAVDVGTNQLAWKLRQDPRVIVHEKANARYLTEAVVTEPVDLIVRDASFISPAKVLDTALGFAKPGGRLVALVNRNSRPSGPRSARAESSGTRKSTLESAPRPGYGSKRRGGKWPGSSRVRSLVPEGNEEFLLAAQRS